MSLTASLVKTAALVGYEFLKAESGRKVDVEKHPFIQMIGNQGVKLVSIALLKDLMRLLGSAGLIGMSLLVASQGLQNSELEAAAVWLTCLGFGLYFLMAIVIYSLVRSASSRFAE